MKSIHRRIAIISLSTLLFTSAGAALAFGGPKGHGGCERGGKQGPMAALTQLDNLTTEQKEVLKDIRKSTRNAIRDLRDEMEDNRTDLYDAMADNADMDTIRRMAEKQGDKVTRMIVLRAEVRNKIDSVLTEEQRKQLQDMRRPGRGEFGPGPKGF